MMNMSLLNIERRMTKLFLVCKDFSRSHGPPWERSSGRSASIITVRFLS